MVKTGPEPVWTPSEFQVKTFLYQRSQFQWKSNPALGGLFNECSAEVFGCEKWMRDGGEIQCKICALK